MDELIATLEREAEERCAAVLAEAEQQAERLRREAEARMNERRTGAWRALEAELQARDAAEGAAARTEIRGVVLRARRSALDRVFRRARGLLPEAVKTPAWEASVPAELSRALACLADVDVEVTCPRELGGVVRAASASLSASTGGDTGSERRLHVVEEVDAPPGFALHGMVTNVRVDATLPTRLAAARPELEMRVLRRMEENA